MAFPKRRREKIAKKFGIPEKDLLRAAARISGYINKHGCNAATIADSLRFLLDTIEEHQAKNEKKEFAYHFQNYSYQKYEFEIVKLFQYGMGAKRISDAIVAKKGTRIPKSSIERFLKNNGIRRSDNG